MNREEMPRIRLKVATTAGINILCTALRKWKVAQWLPHIEQAFRQVKEDQGQDQDSKKTFIKALRLKKGEFYIANSEIIGDVFQDNDEVQCEIDFKGQIKKQVKEQKKKKKNQSKEQIEKIAVTNDKKDKSEKKISPKQQTFKETEFAASKPRKKRQIEEKMQLLPEGEEVFEKHIQKVQIQHKDQSLENKNIQKNTVRISEEEAAKSTKNEKIVKVDVLQKLKSLIIMKSSKKPEPTPIKEQSPAIDSEQPSSPNSL